MEKKIETTVPAQWQINCPQGALSYHTCQHKRYTTIYCQFFEAGESSWISLTSLLYCSMGHQGMPLGQENQICNSRVGEGSCFQGHWSAHQGLLNSKSAMIGLRMCLEQVVGRWLLVYSRRGQKCSTEKKYIPYANDFRALEYNYLLEVGWVVMPHTLVELLSPLYINSNLLINSFVILNGVMGLVI